MQLLTYANGKLHGNRNMRSQIALDELYNGICVTYFCRIFFKRVLHESRNYIKKRYITFYVTLSEHIFAELCLLLLVILIKFATYITLDVIL